MTTRAIPRQREGVRGPSIWQRIWESRLAYLYILPGVIVMAIITFFPLFFQVWMSLTDYGITNLKTSSVFLQIAGSFSTAIAEVNPDVSAPNLVGIQNFVRIMTNDLALPGYDFWYMLSFNLIWTFINVFFHVALGVAFAMLLNIEKLRFKRIYRAFYIIPWALPALISGMVWRNMYDTNYGAVNLLAALEIDWINETTPPVLNWLGETFLSGPLNNLVENLSSLLYFLIAFAVIGLIVGILAVLRRYDPEAIVRLPVLIGVALLGAIVLLMIGWQMPWAFYAVLIANIWLGWPFMMTVATGALQGIPNELYEAARIDGASGWQSFWQITLPLLRPALVPASVIGMMMTFNQFNVIYFVTGGNPLHRTEILVTQAFRLVNEQRLYGVAASFSIIVFIVLAIITMITNRISQATESYTN
jgi:arabinogalactan oligomer/maltooligosaccharide transport system permease protein